MYLIDKYYFIIHTYMKGIHVTSNMIYDTRDQDKKIPAS